jgi:hypothetical protein
MRPDDAAGCDLALFCTVTNLASAFANASAVANDAQDAARQFFQQPVSGIWMSFAINQTVQYKYTNTMKVRCKNDSVDSKKTGHR